MTIQAVMAGIARDVMGYRYPVSDLVMLYFFADLHNLTGNLVPQHQRRLFDAIPFHHIASADTAG
jgi:hypothetical protein